MSAPPRDYYLWRGQRLTMRGLAQLAGCLPSTLRHRINGGRSIEEAIAMGPCDPRRQRDLSGMRVGKLTVSKMIAVKNKQHVMCTCDCGKSRSMLSHKFLIAMREQTRLELSCGCVPRKWLSEKNHDKIRDLTGQRFGCLVVVRLAGRNSQGSTTWECRCDCGNRKEIQSSSLVRRSASVPASCGCKRHELKFAKARKYQFNGHAVSVSELAVLAGCKLSTMFGRLRERTVEEAIAMGRENRRKGRYE